MSPADRYWTTIHLSDSVDGVWRDVFEGQVQGQFWRSWVGGQRIPSIIVKVTRILLSLVVALSVTMILYHGLSYIIQTGQWKEGKDLIKNVVYIVIWILVSLFSVIIITLLQSVSTTLDESEVDWHQETDNQMVYTQRKWSSWTRRDIADSLNRLFDNEGD